MIFKKIVHSRRFDVYRPAFAMLGFTGKEEMRYSMNLKIMFLL